MNAVRVAFPPGIVYQTEWLGWLPFGQYPWVDVERADGKDDVALRFPGGWEMADVVALEQAGLLRRVREEHEDASGMDRIVFEMTEEG
jgi:hypothetical protein